MPTITTEYYGMEGTGKTVKEAKADASRKIEKALAGSYEPKVLASRGVVMLVWRDPHGWRSCTITDGNDDKGNGGFRDSLSYSSGTDLLDAMTGALLHLAHQTWDGAESFPPCFGDINRLKTRRDVDGRYLISEFDSWRRFQLAFKLAKQNFPEQSHHEWHSWACDHAHEMSAAC